MGVPGSLQSEVLLGGKPGSRTLSRVRWIAHSIPKSVAFWSRLLRKISLQDAASAY